MMDLAGAELFSRAADMLEKSIGIQQVEQQPQRGKPQQQQYRPREEVLPRESYELEQTPMFSGV